MGLFGCSGAGGVVWCGVGGCPLGWRECQAGLGLCGDVLILWRLVFSVVLAEGVLAELGEAADAGEGGVVGVGPWPFGW